MEDSVNTMIKATYRTNQFSSFLCPKSRVAQLEFFHSDLCYPKSGVRYRSLLPTGKSEILDDCREKQGSVRGFQKSLQFEQRFASEYFPGKFSKRGTRFNNKERIA